MNAVQREIIFKVPGSKVFISDYYKNTKDSFLNISITGEKCELNCPHCRTHLLKSMDFPQDPNHLENFISSKVKSGNLKGFLISGGFDKEGRLSLNDYLGCIKKIKTRHPYLKIYVHSGFVDAGEAKKIKKSGIDGVLANVISSRSAIETVYNLPGYSPEDYYQTLENLKKAGNKTAPHIIIGLDHGIISSEFEALRQISNIGADCLVFVIVKKLTKEINFPEIKDAFHEKKEVDVKGIISLISFAQKLMPGTPISLGCAKPAIKNRGQLEIGLLKNGINIIAFPAEETINYVISEKMNYRFEETCCAGI
ncbi:MAG: radical SAM protein [Candidatus Humimicrobiaceae bacterium]